MMSAVEGRKLAGPFCEHGYSVLSASISANEKTSLRAERLDAVICQFLKEQNVPGATLAVAKHGCLVYEQGYGVAGAGRRMRADTALRVASISKPITAIAVLRLCQEGTLSLDARVFGSTGILKRLKPRGDKRLKRVTVRHLLQHSAGWDRDMVGDAVFENAPLPDGMERTSGAYNAHLLQRILYRKLQFTPGSRHAYSNLGYLVLGEVVDAVTGQSYESYLKSILAQIGINGMYVGSEERASWLSSEGEYFNVREPSGAPSVMPGQADSRVVPQYGSFLMRNSGAYGGWVATARDLVKVLCCLEEAVKGRLGEGVSGPDRQDPGAPDAVLSASSVLTMLECPSYESGGRDWYGLGVDVQDGGHTWGHTGAMEGSSATCQRHRSGVTWALVLNAWASNMDLDGVVKSALSAVPHLSPFPSHLAQVCGQVLRVFTADQGQCVVVHVPLHNLSSLIAEKNLQGFAPVWISVNTVDGKNVDFNAVFSKDLARLGRKWVVLTEVSHLPSVLKTCSEDGIHPELITTYTNDDGSPHAVVVLAQREGSCGREVEVCVPVARYLPLLTQRKKNGFRVVSQCVTQCPHTGQLLVTAIMDREGDTLTNTMTNIEEGSFAKETVIHSKDTETDDSGLLKTHAEEKVSKQLKTEDSDIKTDQNGPLRTQAQEIISKQLKTEQRGCEESEEGGYSEREHTSTEGSTSAESEGVGSCDSASDRGHKTGDVGYHGGEDSRVCMTGDVLDPAGEGRRESLEEVPSGSRGVNADRAVYLNNEGNAQVGLRRSSCSSVEGKRSSVEGKRSFVEGKPSSVEGKPSSVEGKPSSVEGKPSSVEGKPSSVEGKPSSVEGKPSSVEGKPSSVVGKLSSVEGKPSSVEGKPSSVEGKPSSVEGKPSSDEGKLSSVEGKPSSVEGKPSSVEGKPSSVEGKPSSVEGKRSFVEGKPSSVEGKPSSVEGKPSSVEGKPSSVEGKPSSVEGKPSSVEGKPSSVEGKPSSVEGKPLSIEGKPSSVEGKPSSVEGKPSSVEGKPSSVEGKLSSVEVKPSSVEGKPSSVEGKPSSVEGKPLSVEGKHSSVEGKRSSVEGKPSSVEGKPSQHLSPTLLGSSNISLKSDHCVQIECEKSNHSQPEGAIRLISSFSSTTKRKRRTKSRPVTQLKTLTYVQLEVDSFVAEMARQAKRGCGLQNVHFFPAEDRKWYVSGVWSPSCTHNCYHRMAVSGLGLLPALAEAAAGNVRLKFVCQYEEDGATYYALFWEGPEFGQANKKCRS